jgi:uncharacterized protein (DUF362 family)
MEDEAMSDTKLRMTRRELLAGVGLAAGAAALGFPARITAASKAPAAPVSIAKCGSYKEDLPAKLNTMFDQIGGIGRLVKGKTVAIKLNLTGNPNTRYPGNLLPMETHNTHQKLVEACCHLLERAGARRIRIVEGATVPAPTLEDYMLDGGWDIKSLLASARSIELERTTHIGSGKKYSRLKVPFGGYMFPAFDLNHSYEDTDVYVSMPKLKNHKICGVTLSLKNNFGITPISIYGDDAGVDEPNESARKNRAVVMHNGQHPPSKSAPQELHPDSPRDPGYRLPRIIVDLVAARPIDLVIIDGVQACVAEETPFAGLGKPVHPGVLIAGRNPVCCDAVALGVMGYDPNADRGGPPFRTADNVLKLAEAAGIGTMDLKQIEVRGVPIRDAVFDYDAQLKAKAGG